MFGLQHIEGTLVRRSQEFPVDYVLMICFLRAMDRLRLLDLTSLLKSCLFCSQGRKDFSEKSTLCTRFLAGKRRKAYCGCLGSVRLGVTA